MKKFPSSKQREKYYQEEGRQDYQARLYGNPSDWIHHRIKDLSLKALEQLLKDRNRPKVLDIGCAEGLYLRKLSSLIDRGWGMDIAQNKINRAKEYSRKFDNLDFVKGDFLDYDFGQKGFDLVFSIETLEHIPEIEEVLEKIKKLVKKKGFFVCSVPTDKEMIFYHHPGDWQQASGHLYEWSKQDFKRLLSSAGFRILKVQGVNNLATQVFSRLAYTLLKDFKGEQKVKKEPAGAGKRENPDLTDSEKKDQWSLTRGAKAFYWLDKLFTRLPFFRGYNNYNIFVCLKE